MQRTCNRCQQEKTTEEFHRRKSGWQSVCKQCRAELDAGRARLGSREALRAAWARAGQDPARKAYQRALKRRQYATDAAFRAAVLLRNSARRGSMRVGALAAEFGAILRDDPCAYCAGQMQHVDHIVPLARGGTSDFDNLTAACGPCNRRKSDKGLLWFLLDEARA